MQDMSKTCNDMLANRADNTQTKRILRTAEMKILRNNAGYSRMDKRRNKEIKETFTRYQM